MSEEKNGIKKEEQSGLKLNIRTIIGVCAILLVIMAVAGALTQTVPRGLYDRSETDGMIIDGTYHEIDFKLPIWKIIASPILVFASENITTGIAIVLFIVLLGGTFLILDKIGVLRYVMAVILKKFSDKKYILL